MPNDRMTTMQETPLADKAEHFAALSHPLRLQVIELLIDAPDGVPAGVIADKLQVRQNTLSTHLAQLSRAKFINGLRRGREIIYSLNHSSLSELQSTVGRMYRHTAAFAIVAFGCLLASAEKIPGTGIVI